MKFPTLVFAASLLATPAFAESTIKASDGFIFETPKTARAGAGYVTLSNTGTSDDSLVGVEADFPRVMIHDMNVTDGVARMFHIDKLDIPAGSEVKLEPGGAHVMFMGLDGDPFEEGEMVRVKLIFENSDPQTVMMHVRKRGSKGGATGNAGHSNTNHSNHSSD